jgi:DnaK suppressor protein
MKKSRRMKAKKPVVEKAGRAPVRAKGVKKAGRAPVRAKGIKKADREQMKAVKNMLFDMKERLLKEIAENVKMESETLKAEIGDLYDIASRDRERELTLLLGDRGREKLMQIEEALGRIEEGSYGFCEECGEKISTGRLMVLPFTKVCVECKSKIEREEEVVKTLEEEGTYQSLVSFDLDEDES